MTDLLYLLPNPAKSLELAKILFITIGFMSLFVSGKKQPQPTIAEKQEVRFVPPWLKETVLELPDTLREKVNNTYRDLLSLRVQADENRRALGLPPPKQ